MIAATLIYPLLEKHHERKDAIRKIIGENTISIIDELIALDFRKGHGFDKLSPESKTLHLAVKTQYLKNMLGTLNQYQSNSGADDNVLSLEILMLYKHGITLNLSGATDMEENYLALQKDMILSGKSIMVPPTAQILPFRSLKM